MENILLQILTLKVEYKLLAVANRPIWHFDNCLRSLQISHYADTYSKNLSFVESLTSAQQKYIKKNILNQNHLDSFLELSAKEKIIFLGAFTPKIESLFNGEFDETGFFVALSTLSECQILNALNQEQMLEDEWRQIEYQNNLDEQERQDYEYIIEAAKCEAADLFDKYAHLEIY